jgi:hypothetical protein
MGWADGQALVLCRVKGNQYLPTLLRRSRAGWITRRQIFGRLVALA